MLQFVSYSYICVRSNTKFDINNYENLNIIFVYCNIYMTYTDATKKTFFFNTRNAITYKIIQYATDL